MGLTHPLRLHYSSSHKLRPSEFLKGTTTMRRLTDNQFREITRYTRNFTSGNFRLQAIGGDLGHGARFIDGVRQLVWLGSEGGRWVAAAYYIAATRRWSSLSGRSIAKDWTELAIKVHSSTPHRWASRVAEAADQGCSDAENRWAAANTLTVVNDHGVRIRAVRLDASPFAYPAGAPLIEFYDTRHKHTDYGQFITRYNLDLLTKPRPVGLTLDGGVSDWSLTAANVAEIRHHFGFTTTNEAV